MKLKQETTIATSHRCRKAGCKRNGDYARGLCEPCYRGLAQLVSQGVVSWKKLESQGKVDTPKMTLKEWALS